MKYSKRTIIFVQLLIVSFRTFITCARETNEYDYALCTETEKQALLNFKKSLEDPSHLLSSWNDSSRDCCAWEHVACDRLTGHVREIHLQSPISDSSGWNPLRGGKINPSLLNLKHLAYLDLSGNDFVGSNIPSFFGSFVSLEYLNLSHSRFQGIIPRSCGNLSSLRTLDLSGLSSLKVDNIQWLSNLVNLEYLNMNHVNLSRASDWLKVVNELPNLIEVHLSFCNLDSLTPLDRLNFSSLQVLDMSDNHFDSLFPSWIFNLSNLVSLELQGNYLKGPIPSCKNMADKLRYLDLSSNEFNSTLPNWLFNSYSIENLQLSDNNLSGGISNAIGNLSSLRFLDLSYNEFSGKIPWKLGTICNLEMLYLSYNEFEGDFSDIFGSRMSKCFTASLLHLVVSANSLSGELTERLGDFSSLTILAIDNNKLVGKIPSSFGQLSNLERLTLGYNMLEGIVTENHFSNLSMLSYLSASRNSLNLRVQDDWTPPFQLVVLFLDSWNLGPQFPLWLQTQRRIDTVDLSNTGISGEVPIWFWSLPSLYSSNLSHNQLSGKIPYFNSLKLVFLSSNNFSGPLPILSSGLRELDLSNNLFSGGISRILCNKNKVLNSLVVLHLERNNLSGEIPECWKNWPSLYVLNLGNNNFFGKIPSSLGLQVRLQSLNLHNNSVSGRIPSSVQNCTRLFKLDLSGNKLEGNIPAWIGSLSELRILILRSNNFSGEIAPEICRLRFLHILDTANNKFSGGIPTCLNHLILMSSQRELANFTELVYFSNVVGSFIESASLTTKGSILQYDSILSLFNSIDLSNNQLSGNIPKELTGLEGLRSLNLSGNCLSGIIPDNIGDMLSLESLDFSKNNIFGEIPIGLARLTALNYLNLSYNNLSGRIPQSTQLQSFSSSSFTENELCGLPLPKKCEKDDENTIPSSSENNKEASHHHLDSGHEIDMWFYVCMGFGFIVGFFIWWVALIFKNSRRYAYFKLLDDIFNKVFYL